MARAARARGTELCACQSTMRLAITQMLAQCFRPKDKLFQAMKKSLLFRVVIGVLGIKIILQ